MREGSIRLAAPVAPSVLVFLMLALGTALTKKPWFDEVHFTGPAVAYLNQHAGPIDLIFAASELAFGLGFYGNVEEPGYGEAFRGFAAIIPALGRYVQKNLKGGYREVYTNSVYEIYARR